MAPRLRLASSADEFKALTADTVRVIRQTVPALSRPEGQLLSDLSRGRYLDGVFRFLGIMRLCANPLHAALWTERLRGFVLAGHPALELPMAEAFRWEEHANHDANCAQLDWWLNKSVATGDRLIESMLAQELASRAVRDAWWRDRPLTLRLT